MELVERQIKPLHGGHHHLREQGGAVGSEESGQGASDGVVPDEAHRAGLQPVGLRSKGADRLLLAVDGLAFHEHRAKQDADALGEPQSHAAVPRGDEALEVALELEALQEVVDQRERTQTFRPKPQLRIPPPGGLPLSHLATIVSPDHEGVNA